MKILLISNDIRFISEVNNNTTIVNSILLGSESPQLYDYIIIDEQNLIIEGNCLELFDKEREKISILGYTPLDEYIFINKDEFNLDNVELYYGTELYKDNEQVHLEPIELEKEIENIRTDYIEPTSVENPNIKSLKVNMFKSTLSEKTYSTSNNIKKHLKRLIHLLKMD